MSSPARCFNRSIASNPSSTTNGYARCTHDITVCFNRSIASNPSSTTTSYMLNVYDVEFQSLNRVQSLFNHNYLAVIAASVGRVSIAQSRPIPLQQDVQPQIVTRPASFNRSIASNPSSTHVCGSGSVLSSREFQSLNRVQSLFNRNTSGIWCWMCQFQSLNRVQSLFNISSIGMCVSAIGCFNRSIASNPSSTL